MGLLVPEFGLPNGNVLSNVYVTYHNAMVYTFPVNGSTHQMSAVARVYSTPEMLDLPIFEFPVEIPNSNINQGPFVNMYTALKAMFPNARDC